MDLTLAHTLLPIAFVIVLSVMALKFAVTVVKLLGILLLFTALGSGLVYTPFVRATLHLLFGINP